MASYLDELQSEAARRIDAMQAAALAAREAHADAELMRHMLTTARKVAGKPRQAAVATVVEEWMRAWHLAPDAWPHVAREMTALTVAFCDYVAVPDAAADRRIRDAHAALKQAVAAPGVTLADHMAWRSRCAHGWWAQVRPAPEEVRRAGEGAPAEPFWAHGCPEDCL
jgi:hypothetical protein